MYTLVAVEFARVSQFQIPPGSENAPSTGSETFGVAIDVAAGAVAAGVTESDVLAGAAEADGAGDGAALAAGGTCGPAKAAFDTSAQRATLARVHRIMLTYIGTINAFPPKAGRGARGP